MFREIYICIHAGVCVHTNINNTQK
jgi:hypothetical protein